MSTDPLGDVIQYQSPYVYADNSPITKVDVMGLHGGHSGGAAATETKKEQRKRDRQERKGKRQAEANLNPAPKSTECDYCYEQNPNPLPGDQLITPEGKIMVFADKDDYHYDEAQAESTSNYRWFEWSSDIETTSTEEEPEEKPVKKKKGLWARLKEGAKNVWDALKDVSLSDIGHGLLDILGFIPGIGGIFDGINAAWYLLEGDYVNASISAGGILFDGIVATKWGKNAAKASKGSKGGTEAAGTAGAVVAKSNRFRKTAIGRMDDLAKYDDIADVDTWHKTGRKPGVGDKPVTWSENKKWLQERIDRGDEFILATDPSTLPPVKGGYKPGVPNGYFTARELDYLRKHNAKITYDF